MLEGILKLVSSSLTTKHWHTFYFQSLKSGMGVSHVAIDLMFDSDALRGVNVNTYTRYSVLFCSDTKPSTGSGQINRRL